MNRLDKAAFTMASVHQRCCREEKDFIEMATCEAVQQSKTYSVPYIQRQAFAERAHYYWLCLTRGLSYE